MRYRLSTLLVAMVWVGLVCLALRSPNQWWSGGMFAALVLVLLTSVLVAIYRTGQWRAMAIGFFAFSAGYLVVEGNFWPAAGVNLPTEDVVNWSYKQLHLKGSWREVATSVDQFDPYEFRYRAYKGICISSLAIVVGVMGGVIAQALYYSRPGDRSPLIPVSG
jgi:hypothetical protein